MQAFIVMLGIVMPLCGVLWLGWSVGTLMILLAVENGLALGLMWLRIRRHEQLSGDPRHRQRGAYRRFGKWEMPAPRGRFLLDYGMQSLVGGLALLSISVLMPFLYAHENPAQSARMLPHWDDVGVGAAAALVSTLIEAPSVMRGGGGEGFPLLKDAALRRYMVVIGSILVVMATPLLADVWNSPLVLLLGLIAVKTGLEVAARAGQV